MALNKGQIYEKNLFNELKKNGKVPQNITTVEQIEGQDITVYNRKGESGIEIKSTYSAAFGSGTLKFDFNDKVKPWKLLKESSEDEDGEEINPTDIMNNIAKTYKLAEKVNKKWYTDNGNYYPLYLEEDNKIPVAKIKAIPRSKRGQRDFEVLHEFKIRCNKSDVEDYYTSKGSYYIQIKGKGLYWLGKKDPLNISSMITRFNPTETYIRVRVHNKGGGKYNFSYGLYIKNLSASKFDLDDNTNPSWLGSSGNP